MYVSPLEREGEQMPATIRDRMTVPAGIEVARYSDGPKRRHGSAPALAPADEGTPEVGYDWSSCLARQFN